MFPLILTIVCTVTASADGDLRTRGLENLALNAQVQASGSAGATGQKYAIETAFDGNPATWWASADRPRYPVTIEIALRAPETVDTLAFIQADNPALYTNIRHLRVEFSDGSSVEQDCPDSSGPQVIRFEARRVETLKLSIEQVHDPGQHYVTLREVMLFSDPEHKVGVKMAHKDIWKAADTTPQGREQHPCVTMTPEDVARARERVATEKWARDWFSAVQKQADEWEARPDEWYKEVVPGKGACFAYGFTGCPICRASWGTWGSARCSFDNPGHVTCANGHVLPDAEHPDDGTGYKGPDGRIHYFVGSYNAWVTETLQFKALANLVLAYTITGEGKYAEKAAFILDLLADIYPSCDAGSWDYPSDPPSGRFARPWYQVARVLVHFVDWYDQCFHSPAMDRPSVREGLSRRQNIETNLLQNGGTYCYEESLKGRLHNGEADYVRGALAVGCCLGIPWYIDWAYDGPYGILSFVRNNVDRDGKYFETSTGYSDHTNSLYLTFAEPLLNWRSEKYPQGINLHDDPQFQSFYVLPQLSFNCAGKEPRFGDSSPDQSRSFMPPTLYSDFDNRMAQRLYSRCSDPAARARFASLLWYLNGPEAPQVLTSRLELPWAVFHGEMLGEEPVALDPILERKIRRCDFFGQKGFTMLRSGEGPQAQAALVRFGPTLNHGHLDDLNLNYTALGYEVTYDIGYSLGSTHTQVGWAKQTASHNLVMVDEMPQGQKGSGTGGSMYALADLPGLKLTDVAAEACYAQQGVSTYRRLLALVGEGPEQYLVDIFRVAGGGQHDYLLHALSDDAQFAGVELGQAEEGSLAGPEVRWGALQLNDGDMEGHPNAPYWNPPPGNGLGFLMEPQRGRTDGNWQATWRLPEGDSFLRLTVLGQPETEVITAWAPGLYPAYQKARYAIARRNGEPGLQSTFIGVLEPYAERREGVRIDSGQISAGCIATGGETRYLANIGTLLFKAAAAGDELRWTFELSQAGEYGVELQHYQSPSYGKAQLLIDGVPVGEVLTGTAGATAKAPTARLGKVTLAAGEHSAALRLVADDGSGNYWFGVSDLWLTTGEDDSEAKPFIASARRLNCDDQEGAVGPAGLAVTLQSGARDLIAGAADSTQDRTFSMDDAKLTLQGCFGHVRLQGELPVAVDLVDSRRLALDGLQVACATAAYRGALSAVDVERAVVHTTAELPADGRLTGQVIYFDSPAYSRNTAHRIAAVQKTADGSLIRLESPSLILGTGILDDEPLSETQFDSLLAHEYARSDSVTGTQFFSGKRVQGEGFSSSIVRTDFGQPLRYTVDSTAGMDAGAQFVICDVQEGDSFTIPVIAHLERKGDGSWQGTATARVVVTEGGKEVGRIGG